jgi:hypothetical protein
MFKVAEPKRPIDLTDGGKEVRKDGCDNRDGDEQILFPWFERKGDVVVYGQMISQGK